QVCVRVRPVLPSEEYTGTQTIISVEGNSCVLVDPTAFGAAAAVARDSGQTLDINAWARHFTFDHCFWSANIEDPHYSGQNEVYKFIGARALEQAWQGYNCTILAYGQTGSGKSYSMMGLEPVHRSQVRTEDGLIPRICESLFAEIAEATRCDGGGDGAELSFGVEVSYLEIYNEQVRDLFGPQAAPGRAPPTLRVREDP
ncbi:P-loop containing nucleoside triphosphate hydrolase protein, partial [Tribonema minus]